MLMLSPAPRFDAYFALPLFGIHIELLMLFIILPLC